MMIQDTIGLHGWTDERTFRGGWTDDWLTDRMTETADRRTDGQAGRHEVHSKNYLQLAFNRILDLKNLRRIYCSALLLFRRDEKNHSPLGLNVRLQWNAAGHLTIYKMIEIMVDTRTPSSLPSDLTVILDLFLCAPYVPNLIIAKDRQLAYL